MVRVNGAYLVDNGIEYVEYIRPVVGREEGKVKWQARERPNEGTG